MALGRRAQNSPLAHNPHRRADKRGGVRGFQPVSLGVPGSCCWMVTARGPWWLPPGTPGGTLPQWQSLPGPPCIHPKGQGWEGERRPERELRLPWLLVPNQGPCSLGPQALGQGAHPWSLLCRRPTVGSRKGEQMGPQAAGIPGPHPHGGCKIRLGGPLGGQMTGGWIAPGLSGSPHCVSALG